MYCSVHVAEPTNHKPHLLYPKLLPSCPCQQNCTITNTTIYFDLKVDNKNKDKGIHYDALNLTIYYGPNRTHGYPVANKTIPGFYQGHKKKALRKELVDTYGLLWAALPNDTAVFRVDLNTKVRFKIMFWNTKRDKIFVGALVEVNATGHKVNPKGIKLRSAAPDLACYHARLLLLFPLFILSLLLLI